MRNQNHQPYENWMFESSSLTIEQRGNLYEHLRVCPQCRQVQQEWDGVIQQIHRAPQVKPTTGFSQRWRMSVDARREMQVRSQTWKLLLWLTGVAFLSLFVLAIQIGADSPVYLIISQMKTFTRAVAEFFIIFKMIATFFQMIPSTVALLLSVTLIGVFSVLTIIWIRTFMRISKQGVYSKS